MSPRERFIRIRAAQLGLDPNAVVANSLGEGAAALRGGNSIGDHGTSFGPFQLHAGGALPANVWAKGPAYANQWSNSEAGIDYALRKQSQVAAGLHGPAAVAAIVSKFERPADIPGQIAARTRNLGLTGGAGIQTSAPNFGSSPAPPNASGGLTSQALRSMAAATLLQQSAATAAGAPPDSSGLLALAIARRQVGAAQQTYGPEPTQGSVTSPSKGGGGYLSPTNGKIIGTPYHGTHTIGNWESDNAVDIAAPIGTPLRATANGVIGPQFGSLGEGGRFAGLRLHLVTNGNEFYYAHLSRFAPGIQPGARVRKGQIIGYSGEANGVAHLHLGAKNGNPLNFAR